MLARAFHGVPQFLDEQQVQSTVGRNEIPLSKRSISDILEKLVIDFLLTNHPNLLNRKSGPGYDLILSFPSEVYVNIKTEDGARPYSWLCSSSVISNSKKQVLDSLFFYKLTYSLSRGPSQREVVRITDAAIAGPVASVKDFIVTYERGSPLPPGISGKELPTHYNGRHSFLHRRYFHPI